MKFSYLYRTSDNIQHEDVIEARSRDDVYAQLRVKGIKPIRVVASKLPWWKRISFRWVAIVALVCALAFVVAKLNRVEKNGAVNLASEGSDRGAIGRRQIWGDRAIIDAAARENWRVIFKNPADRLLALFAQPGVRVAMPMIPATIKEDFARALRTSVEVRDSDLEEYRQMKRIVEGMKEEMREYLADGGNIDGYVSRMVDRQNAEADVFDRERRALEDLARSKSVEEIMPLWNDANRRLRAIGLKTLSIPYQPGGF